MLFKANAFVLNRFFRSISSIRITVKFLNILAADHERAAIGEHTTVLNLQSRCHQTGVPGKSGQ